MSTHEKRGLQCDHTWHLRKLGALSLAIYDKIGAITYEPITGQYGIYYSSGRKLAEFYDAEENNLTTLLGKLADQGWLQRVGVGPGAVIKENGIHRNVKKDKFKPKDYRYVTHAEWATAHPGQCFVPEEMVWDGEEHDELAQLLHKHSFGETYWYPNMLAGLRSSGMTDDEIVRAWIPYIQNMPKKPNGKAGWKKVAFDFIRLIKIGEVVGAK